MTKFSCLAAAALFVIGGGLLLLGSWESGSLILIAAMIFVVDQIYRDES